jgi:hypothetical protein
MDSGGLPKAPGMTQQAKEKRNLRDTLTGKLFFCAPGVQGSFMAGSFKSDVSSE